MVPLVVYDSLSCLKSLENRKFQTPLILDIFGTKDNLLRSGYSVTFWVAARSLGLSKSPVPHFSFKPLVCAYVNSLWQKGWDGETNNKLHRLQPVMNNNRHGNITRRDAVVIHHVLVTPTSLKVAV
jgi:hypothetical protein